MSCVLIVLSLFFKGLSVRDFFDILLVEFVSSCVIRHWVRDTFSGVVDTFEGFVLKNK